MNFLSVIIGLIAVLGAATAIFGLIRIITDPRRIAAYAYTILGAGLAVAATGSILYLEADRPELLIISAIIMVIGLVLGNLVGYPLLTGFLIWAGITIQRRESRSLGNMLALLAGIGLLFLPSTLGFFEPAETTQLTTGYSIRYGIHLGLTLIVTYVAWCFAAFAIASLAYRWRKPRHNSHAVIVLGSGLINGKVPPLLAGRINRGITAMTHDDAQPMLITSGGQGPDEPRSEGSAMRDYAIQQGVPAHRVIAEEESTSTQENLEFSRQLLPHPDSSITVVTSSYHVFRAALLTRQLGLTAHVVGAPTAWYYFPSAYLREFIAVMRDHVRIHALALVSIVALTVAITSWLLPLTMNPGLTS